MNDNSENVNSERDVEVDIDEELALLDSLNEEEVLNFLDKHHHVYTSCNFCNELSTGDGSVIDEVLFRYQSANMTPPEKVVSKLCEALELLREGLLETGNYPSINEVKQLTLFPACTAATYEEFINAMNPSFYEEGEGWTLNEAVKFVVQRAQMPNAPEDFTLRALDEYHSYIHQGSMKDCADCQELISQAKNQG